MRRAGSLALAASLVVAEAAAAAPVSTPKALFLVGDSETVAVARAWRHFQTEHPAAAQAVGLRIVAETDIARLKGQDLSTVRVLLFDTHSQDRSETEKGLKADLVRAVAARGRVVALGESLTPRSAYMEMGASYDERLRDYWAATGWRNVYGMLCLLAREQFGQAVAVPPLEANVREGYYHPAAPGSRWFADFGAYESWYASSGRLKGGRPWVAVTFYSSSLFQDQTDAIDALVAELEAQDVNALPVFGYPAKHVVEKLLLDAQGKPRVQAVLAFTFRFAGPETQEAMLKAGVPTFNVVKVFSRGEKDWRESKTGLSIFEGVWQVAVPELSGLVAPLVVATEEKRFHPELGLTVAEARPVPERVRMAVKRVKRYLALQEKSNSEKRLALVYYNYPPGKAEIGASYLNTLRSVSRMLERLRQEGYDVGPGPLTEEEVTRRALNGGRNVGAYAPGELAQMVKSGQVVRVPRARYQQWFDALPTEYRDKVAKDWGEPDESEGMWLGGRDGLDLVVPAAIYGNIAVLPQPDRGFGQDLKKLYHSMDVTPPHHYLGVYRWLRDDFKADAVVHVGTHGTLEWLSGKSLGLTEADAPDVMLDELPDIYAYNVDVVGEGLVAKRRGMATVVDHMVPPFRKGGLYGEYARIYELVNDHDVASTKDERLAAAYAEELRGQLASLGLLKDLGLDAGSSPLSHDEMHRIQDYFLELKNRNMPYGLHTFGVAPDAGLRASTIEAILEPDRGVDPVRKRAMERQLDEQIQASGPRELDQWIAALDGRYLAVGTGNDPIRNPDSLPTGKNFYGVDPTKIPKKGAWDLGVKLADQMLAEHRRKHDGAWPRKVAFVIWGTETLRHEGVTESQFFHLLGTRPVWDDRGKVVDVEVIPRAKLGRPRVDVVVSSAAEGMFGQLTQLMDKAVQKVNELEEPENFAREHTLANAKKLAAKGHADREALRRASVRIFDEPPGQYNLNVARIVKSSGTWDKETAVSNDYFQKMGHGYGNGFWGENMEDAFRLTLSGTEQVVHSSSSNLYGSLDNDDFFMYAGGLVQAVRHLDGKAPELLVADVRTAGSEQMAPIGRYMGMEFRSRQTNPLWIQGMMKEGYAGAGEMRAHLENLWGWQVTVPESVGDEKWTQAYETYVLDKHDLGLEQFFETASPSARQDMLARMLETVRKGHWSPSADVRARLARDYVRSAREHGFSCVSFVCQNPALARFTVDEAGKAGVSGEELKQFEARLEQVTGRALAAAAAEMRQFVARTEASHSARSAAFDAAQRQPSTAGQEAPLSGLLMEKQPDRRRHDPARPAESAPKWRGAFLTTAIFTVLAVGAWWWIRRRHRHEDADDEISSDQRAA